jgi:hypothetical protein
MVMVAIAGIGSAQVKDSPVSGDGIRQELSDKKSQYTQDMRFFDRLTQILQQLAKGSSDPGPAAAAVHAELQGCFLTAKYLGSNAELYGRGSVEAGKIAERWESKAKTIETSGESNSEREFARQILDAQNKRIVIQGKSPRTPEDLDELRSLDARIAQMQRVLDLLKKVNGGGDPGRYRQAAAEMRAREKDLQKLAEDSWTRKGDTVRECEAGVAALRSLNDQEEIRLELKKWENIPPPDPAPANGKGRQIITAAREDR